jgi:flagellar hook-basal body complex protein FliE
MKEAHSNTSGLKETASRNNETFNYRATFSAQLKRVYEKLKEVKEQLKSKKTVAKSFLGGIMTASQKARLLELKAQMGMYFLGRYSETLSNVEANILIERNS